MRRSLFVLSIALAMSAVAPSAFAQFSSANSQIHQQLNLVPDGSLPYVVIVRDAFNNPMFNMSVTVDLTLGTGTGLDLCATSAAMQTLVTGPDGRAVFFYAGGGCIDGTSGGGSPGVVTVADGSGTVVGTVNLRVANSVDRYNGGFGTCEVGLTDAVFHTQAIATGAIAVCSDFTAPYGDPVSLSDAVIIGAHVTAGTSCAH